MSIIIKTVFQSFRELLILGKILNLKGLFTDAKLFCYKTKTRTGDIVSVVRMKISTPSELKYHGKQRK